MAKAILVATTTAQVTIDGQEVLIVAGKTTVREGHPVLAGRESLFEPLRPVYDYEEPAEVPSVTKPARGKSTGTQD